jgi:hypothetical protein
MGIPIELEKDFKPAMKKIMDRLTAIEQALVELNTCEECKVPVAPKTLPKKVK